MELYLQLAICFAAIGLSALIAEKTKLFFAPFYIAAGFLLGPGCLNLVNETELIALLGEVGVVFLLFFLGLEFSLNDLLEQRKAMLSAGLIDFVINFGLGLGLGFLLGLSFMSSFAVAGAIYMSSSGIITKSLLELNVDKNPEGRMIMGIMIFEDLVMIFFLAVISVGFTSGEGLHWTNALLQVGKALAFLVIFILFAKYGKRFLHRVLSIHKSELLLLVFFGTVLIITAIGQFFGVSIALTAFFLGMAFSETDNVKNIEHNTIMFRDLFGSVFYFSFGLILQLSDLTRYWDIMIYVVLLSIAGKLLSGFIITRLSKCENNMALFIGFITIPHGEFSLVISDIARSHVAFLDPVMVVVVMTTTLISSLVLRFSKMMCKLYNVCFIYPKSKLTMEDEDWGEVD